MACMRVKPPRLKSGDRRRAHAFRGRGTPEIPYMRP